MLSFLLLIVLLAMPLSSAEPTIIGLERIDEFHHLFANKRVGLVINQTSLNRSGEHITDIFLKLLNVEVTALFGPEHGVRGQAADGDRIGDEFDETEKIPIYSLYGKTKKPTLEMLENVDLLVFDMQDIGVRFYTFVWTMYLVMHAAAENGVPIVVLDRPNPIGGPVEGPLLQPNFVSFVGLKPLPVRHGMTIGELAALFNDEGWLGDHLCADLTVIPMKNWHHDMWYDETGLAFTPPSPNMPNLETAAVYPGLCLLEGTNVSEGRGTDAPFLTFGAPWIDGTALCQALKALKLPGVDFQPVSFTPRSIPGKARHPKFENQRCKGAHIIVTGRDSLNAFSMGLSVIRLLHEMYPDSFRFRSDGHFDLLCGTDSIRKAIEKGASVQELEKLWMDDLNDFAKLRKKYLIYPENEG